MEGAIVKCFHCGTPCRDESFASGDKSFCCHGCLAVFELLSDNGLSNFYELSDTAGVRIKATRENQFKYLDDASVRERLVNFRDQRITRVTFHIPAIHCIACVWLLENLFRLKLGIGESQVNFPRKEVVVTFENARVQLSEVVALLTSLGYEPELKLSDLNAPRENSASRQLWLQIAITGFAFGNLMLLALGVYFGVDTFSGPLFRKLAGYFGLLLSIPVVTYGALHYWRTAWTNLKQRRLAIEVPIAAGIVAIFAQSTYEVLSGSGEGYFDSLSGLIFLLNCGRLFQQKTFDRLSFERDYQSFFPLSVTRRTAGCAGRSHGFNPADARQNQAAGEEHVALAQLRINDVLVIRNGELIPADAQLLSDVACLDYSFVTGESEPVSKLAGDYLYAGGRQMGGVIEVKMVKPVSQSYLTSLWNQEAFRKDKHASFESLINRFSYRFTIMVSAIAVGAAVFWLFRDPSKSLKAFTSVLIVACPCALALAAPFTLGTAIRALARRQVFVKSPEVVEALAKVDAVVFDKTGTLTAAGAQSVTVSGTLSEDERRWIHSLARHSTHPLSVRMADALPAQFTEPVRSFRETVGGGIEGVIAGHRVMLGSETWLGAHEITVRAENAVRGSVVHVAIDGEHRACFVLESGLREQVSEAIRALSLHCELTLLSGDNEKQKNTFTELFGERSRFNQSPLEKLEFIHTRQRSGKCVAMLGDGLNDSGALRQADVGIAVVENVSAFSPASDVIMSAEMVSRLDEILRFSRQSARIVRLSFLLSSLYNLVGVSIAASGLLAPIVCAILMPLSSISVVAFACGATALTARRIFGDRAKLVASAATDGEPLLVV